jgi:hypothetical protein
VRPSPALSRRAFLRRGGTLALATGAAALVPLGRLPFASEQELADGTLELGPPRKCISLGGPGSLREDHHPDDYRLWGNREFIRASGTTWVKLWVSWADLQQELGTAPDSRDRSWAHLDTAPHGEFWLRRLDRQARAANADGVGVIVTLFHAFPTWSSGVTGPDPVSGHKPPEQHLPSDLGPDSPWGWFIGYLCRRYAKSAPRNPDRAWVDALEICNEPNLLYWPQEAVVPAVAQMIRTAEELSARLGGPAILAPATSDYPDQDQESEDGLLAQGWHGFTERLLAELGELRPRVPLDWTQHNFNDVQRPERQSRAERVLDLLALKGWPNQVRPLWLTEGGYNLYPNEGEPRARARQARLIEASFRSTRSDPRIHMWTQHTITDKVGNDFKSGLRDDFVPGRGPGAERPAWQVWRELPGSARP